MYVESGDPSFEDGSNLDMAFAGQPQRAVRRRRSGRLWLMTGMHTGTSSCTTRPR